MPLYQEKHRLLEPSTLNVNTTLKILYKTRLCRPATADSNKPQGAISCTLFANLNYINGGDLLLYFISRYYHLEIFCNLRHPNGRDLSPR